MSRVEFTYDSHQTFRAVSKIVMRGRILSRLKLHLQRVFAGARVPVSGIIKNCIIGAIGRGNQHFNQPSVPVVLIVNRMYNN